MFDVLDCHFSLKYWQFKPCQLVFFPCLIVPDSFYSAPQASPASGRTENQWDGLRVVLFFPQQLSELGFNKSIVPIN